MSLRKMLMGEVISPSSPAGRKLRLALELVAHFVFLVGIVLMVPHIFAATALLGAGAIIVIRRKTYSDFGLIQGRGAVLVGASFIFVGSFLAAYVLLKA